MLTAFYVAVSVLDSVLIGVAGYWLICRYVWKSP